VSVQLKQLSVPVNNMTFVFKHSVQLKFVISEDIRESSRNHLKVFFSRASWSYSSLRTEYCMPISVFGSFKTGKDHIMSEINHKSVSVFGSFKNGKTTSCLK
jgi:hypothetical protein